MRLRNLKIGTQLKIGLGAIGVFVALLGAVAWFQAESLWQETKGLYDHPLAVRRALGEIKADVLAMQRGMKDLFLADDEAQKQQILQDIDTREADAHRQIDILYDRFLGPRSHVDDVSQALVQWKAIRDEDIRLVREGKVAEAVSRGKPTGVSGAHVESMMGHIQDVSDFAIQRGDQFYQDAQTHRNSVLLRLAVIVAGILLLSSAISYFLLKGIREPLKELTSVTERYQQGQMDARSRYASANEFGSLAASFNILAETVQTQMQGKEHAARIADVMLREDDLHAFCQELLKALIEHTGSQIGAVYLLNESKADFEHFESIGLGAGGRTSFSAAEREGEFGAALAARQIQRITDIPADTRFRFSTVAGEFQPRDIMTIPILSGSEVVAMISLAGVRGYAAPAVWLVNDVWSVMTARLNGVLAFRQVREFSARLEVQNRELQEQAREMAVQAGELGEQNTELELQKRQLDEASRLKSVFLSNMSHELRTPLNSVNALAGVLSRRLRGVIGAEEYGYLEVIERNGKHLLSLINDILDLSRIEAGREEISLSRFSVGELAGAVVAMIEPQAREKNIALRNRVGEDLPPITGDLAKCQHILQNLVGNAVKFTEAGYVEVSARQEGQEILIVVADTGIGIAEDQLPHIFDEFRQADETLSRKYGGAGLGLAIAKRYAALLRGSIAVESTPGQGSTFTIRLPLTLSAPTTIEPGEEPLGRSGPAESAVPSSASSGQGKCILLVEDSEPAVIQMTDILGGQGYKVQVARNGREALERIEKAPPDAVILDLMMPEVDGFQVLLAIRSAEKSVHLPVLILTAKQITREELSFLKENHIEQLIQKGDIRKADLLAAVKRMVSPRRERPAPRARKPVRTPSGGKPVILVVEDNPDNLKTVKAVLQDAFQIIEATDGRAGLEQAKSHRPDLVLLDISLPGMDGFQVLEAIRDDQTLRHIPVIALTARVMKGDRDEILGRGFDGYVSKPMDEKLLEKTIREFLYGQ